MVIGIACQKKFIKALSVSNPDWNISRMPYSSRKDFNSKYTILSEIYYESGSLETGLKLPSTLWPRPGFLFQGLHVWIQQRPAQKTIKMLRMYKCLILELPEYLIWVTIFSKNENECHRLVESSRARVRIWTRDQSRCGGDLLHNKTCIMLWVPCFYLLTSNPNSYISCSYIIS